MDITLCSWEWCKLKNNCIRYLAKKDKYAQSYFIKPPIKDWECKFIYKKDNNEDKSTSIHSALKKEDKEILHKS